jgi:hypothetical protein
MQAIGVVSPRLGPMRLIGITGVTLLAGALAVLGAEPNREQVRVVPAATAPAFAITLTPQVPSFPLGRLWQLAHGRTDSSSGACRDDLDTFNKRLAAGTALSEDALALDIRLVARDDVNLELVAARVRRLRSTPWLPDLNRQADNLAPQLVEKIDTVCMDRRYARSAEEFSTAISSPQTSAIREGRSVQDMMPTLSEMWADLTYTVEGPQPPTLTLFSGESAQTVIQIVGHGGRLTGDREPFIDRMRVELTLSQTLIGDSSLKRTIRWSSPPLEMLRFLPTDSTN